VAILLKPYSRVAEWEAEIRRVLPAEDVRLWPDVGDPTEVDFVIAWQMSAEEMAPLVNLQAILSLGAGTEQWQVPGIDAPVVRLVDPEMANDMAGYCVAWVLRHQRRFAELEDAQQSHQWEVPDWTQTYAYSVGILGYGEIGSRIGRAFRDLGYPVNGWTRSGRTEEGVQHFAGLDELAAFLGASAAVISVLPSTSETVGLLDSERLAQFAKDAVLINVGRGTVLDESALIDALDTGPLAAAVLDVTSPEPPTDDSPLWTHPAVTLTPHISGMTQVRSASRLIAANVARLRSGEPAFPLLDRSRGY